MFVILQISSFRPFMAGSDQSNRRRQYPEFPDRFYNKVALANRHERTKFKVSNYSTSVPLKAGSD
jgi:hypothetical protein